MSQPQVSIVVSAYNARNIIAGTLQSVLDQDGPSFELIVIDDGSTDRTSSAIKTALTSDVPVTVIRNQPNQGLTKSLIQGCARASGKYIARVDAGDCYLPGRLDMQHEILEQNPTVGLVSCGTRFISAEGEFLYDISQQPDELAQGLACCDLDGVRGPTHHGSTMFRSDLYKAVGGYREVFRVSQDLDLWMRFYEKTEVLAMPEILYEACIFPNSISVGHRDWQVKTTEVILEGARCRRADLPEPDYRSILSGGVMSSGLSTKNLSRYDYFVGGCLEQRDRESASRYFARAWRRSPLNLKYGARYLRSLIR